MALPVAARDAASIPQPVDTAASRQPKQRKASYCWLCSPDIQRPHSLAVTNKIPSIVSLPGFHTTLVFPGSGATKPEDVQGRSPPQIQGEREVGRAGYAKDTS
jgi:hypothetical protein